MKYESTILNRLIDTYGVVGNPHYISEIIKEFIVRGKACFPNLFTYQADWLAHIDEFGLNPSYTVSYTGQSIYAPNTLESPVKSAILTGQTLVNISTKTHTIGILNANFVQSINDINLLKPSTKYLLKIFNHSTEDKNYTTHPTLWVFQSTPVNANSSATYIIQTNADVSSGSCLLRNGSDHTENNNLDVLLIEYQDGMENWDIPYFEGMQSVKMPGLTTTGKNLFDIEKLEGLSANIEMIENGIRIVNSQFDITRCFITPFKENTQYTISFNHKQIDGSGYEGFRFYYTDGTDSYVIPRPNSSYVGSTLPNKTIKSVSLSFNDIGTSELTYIQFEEGSTATSYEPYKSNILTVNEEVELRGVGEVQDTLDCLTGELTQRIGEVVYTEKEDWYHYLDNEFDDSILFSCTSLKIGDVNDSSMKINFISDTFTPSHQIYTQNIIGSYIQNGSLFIRVKKEWLTTPDVYGLKQYLQVNPITIQFPLETESVKTVDLTILDQNEQNVQQLMAFNGGTHFNTTSSEGSPLPTVSVSVETDLEETLMMCSLEGNTL